MLQSVERQSPTTGDGAIGAWRNSAILLTGAHGAAGLGSSGLLRTDKWQTTPEELIDTLVATVADSDRPN